jgi:hypothetical protein
LSPFDSNENVGFPTIPLGVFRGKEGKRKEKERHVVTLVGIFTSHCAIIASYRIIMYSVASALVDIFEKIDITC